MADLTDDIVLVANALKNILAPSNKPILGLRDVFYGDQERIPRNPAICIETSDTVRELNGAPRRVAVRMTIYLMVYHNSLKAGAAGQREQNDQLAVDLQTELHKDINKDLGGLIIHGFCTQAESGWQQKENALWQATRITYEAQSQVMLPYQ
jgi:hypothetical protein